jgi:hypothetical protein
MKCPTSEEYRQWIQNPQVCFAESDLQAGFVEMLGNTRRPKIMSGKFACVFQIANGERRWAVRCFHFVTDNQEERYARISTYLAQAQLPSLAECTYLPKGIRVKSEWYPVVKMEWVDGEYLDRYVRGHLFTREGHTRLVALAEQWRALIGALRDRRIAHGDLHHDNILVAQDGRVRLVDYDGMFVPGLEHSLCHEIGHPNYQHPGRHELRQLNQELDNFAAALIYLSLRAVAVEPQLWTQHYQQDSLLLNEADFKAPDGSVAFARLQKSPDEGVRRLSARLAQACRGPYADIPAFERLVADMPEEVRPTKPTRPKYIVAQQGLANYRSLREAVVAAEPGAQIVVRAGRYAEALVLDKPLLITGEGPVQEIVVETREASALTLNRTQVTVRGLTLRNQSQDSSSYSTVVVREGHLTLEKCHVQSESLAGVRVDGPAARATLRHCRISKCKSSGVLLDNQGYVRIEDSQLAGNKRSGVEVMNGSSACLLRCAVVDNHFEAVWVYEKSTATVEDCDLTGNGRGAWDIRSGATVKRTNNFPDEQQLLSIFRRWSLPTNVYMVPNIPDSKQKRARKSCGVPAWEKILLLVDFSCFGYCREAPVFGRDGVYCKDAAQDAAFAVPYHTLPKVVCSAPYSLLIEDYWVHMNWGAIPPETIEQYLSAIEEEYKVRRRRT